jgi:4-amino-4-deoxy-L-arabinose transferase-like glycosyltransferase
VSARTVASLPKFSLPRWSIIAVLATVLAVFIIRNLPWHLDDYDQAKQAFVSYEMLKEGNWWFQHTPTGRVATKPPLAGWISGTIAMITAQRAWDVAWRLPQLVCGLVILWLLWREGDRLLGTLGAVLSTAAFGLNLFAPRLATLVRTDMMLAMWIFLAGYIVYTRLRDGRDWDARSRWALFFVILASMLTKGPIAYAFLLPGLVAFRWMERRSLDVHRVWAGWTPWVVPLLLFGAWAGVGIWLSRDFYREVVLDEFLGRFTVGEAAKHNNAGPHVYFLQVLHRFFPWSVVLIALALMPEVRARLRRDPALVWLVCWAMGGLVFMSLVPSKRADRIFPIIPPLCLLLPAMLALVPRNRLSMWPLRRLALLVMAIAVLFSGGYAAYKGAQGYRENQEVLVKFGERVRMAAPADRLAVLNGKDEGMLIYAGVTRFTKPGDAGDRWKAGQIDAVVIPLQILAKRAADFPGHRVAFESGTAPEKGSAYALLLRETATQ